VKDTDASILHSFCGEVCRFLYVKCENHIFYDILIPLSLWVHARQSLSRSLAPYIVNLNCSYQVKEIDTSTYSQFVDIFVLCFNYVVTNTVQFSSFLN
jgi:hypothetical protein